jgi:hypothetical protein
LCVSLPVQRETGVGPTLLWVTPTPGTSHSKSLTAQPNSLCVRSPNDSEQRIALPCSPNEWPQEGMTLAPQRPKLLCYSCSISLTSRSHYPRSPHLKSCESTAFWDVCGCLADP